MLVNVQKRETEFLRIYSITQAGCLICFMYVETVFFHLNERTGFLRKIIHNVILKYIKIMSEEQKISQVLPKILISTKN